MSVRLFTVLCVLLAGVVYPARAEEPWLVPPGDRVLVVHETGQGTGSPILIENGYLRAEIRPSEGGRLASLKLKPEGLELAGPAGLLRERWFEDAAGGTPPGAQNWHGKVVEKSSQRAIVKLVLDTPEYGGWRLTKTLTAWPAVAHLQVDYEIVPLQEDSEALFPSLVLQQAMATDGQVHAPTSYGARALPRPGEDQSWVHDLVEPWAAWTAPDRRRGLAMALTPEPIRSVLAEHQPRVCVQWILRRVTVSAANPLKLALRLAPIHGLDSVQAVGLFTTGGITLSKDPYDGTQLNYRLAVLSSLDLTSRLKMVLAPVPDRMGESRPEDAAERMLLDRGQTLRAGQVMEATGHLRMAEGKTYEATATLQEIGRFAVTLRQRMAMGTSLRRSDMVKSSMPAAAAAGLPPGVLAEQAVEELSAMTDPGIVALRGEPWVPPAADVKTLAPTGGIGWWQFFRGGVAPSASAPVARSILRWHQHMGMNAWLDRRLGEDTAAGAAAVALGLHQGTPAATLGVVGGTTRDMVDVQFADDTGLGQETLLSANPRGWPVLIEQARRQVIDAADGGRVIPVRWRVTGQDVRSPALDVGFSRPALDALRDWLAEQYTDIDALNLVWRTEFNAFREVMPMSLAEVRAHGAASGSYAPWVDHRRFLQETWAKLASQIAQAIHSADPAPLVGPLGLSPSAVPGERDLHTLALALTVLADEDPLTLSVARAANPRLATIALIGDQIPTPLLRYALWTRVMAGAAGLGIAPAGRYFGADLQLTTRGRILREATTRLGGGLGALLADAAAPDDGVRILWSPLSALAAHACQRGDLYRDAQRGAWQIMADLALSARAITEQQVIAGRLSDDQVKVLLMPGILALSPDTAEAIDKWVQAGGHVIADLQTGVFDRHGQVRAAGVLDELFGIRREEAALPSHDAGVESAGGGGSVLGSVLEDDARQVQALYVDPGLKLAGAKEAAWEARISGQTQPAVAQSMVGRGYAVYCGFDLPASYDRHRRQPEVEGSAGALGAIQDVMLMALNRAGVQSPVVVVNRDDQTGVTGSRLPWMTAMTRQRGEERYWLIARDPAIQQAATTPLAAMVRFSAPAEMYDVLAGVWLGKTDQLPMQVDDGALRLVALLPRRVGPVSVVAPVLKIRGGESARIRWTLHGGEGRRWTRVDAMAPGGAMIPAVTRVLVSEAESELALPIPTGQPGPWVVHVTDVGTGLSGSGTFTVE